MFGEHPTVCRSGGSLPLHVELFGSIPSGEVILNKKIIPWTKRWGGAER